VIDADVCERYPIGPRSPLAGGRARLGCLSYVVHYQGSRAVRRRRASPDRSRAELSKNLPKAVCGGHLYMSLSRYPGPGQAEQSAFISIG